MKWAGHLTCIYKREMRTKFYLENFIERNPLGDVDVDEDNIKMSFKYTGCEGVDWIHVIQDGVQR